MPGPEAGLRARVLRAIRHTPGVAVWGWPASAFSGAGHPDLFGSACGRFFGLELKTRTGRATLRQRMALRDIRKAGGYAWVVRTVSQAEYALAWILEGRHPPMADEPLNIEDWFKDLPAAETETLPWETAIAADPQPDPEPEPLPEPEPEPAPTHEEMLADLDRRADALDGKGPEPVEPLPAFNVDQQFEEVLNWIHKLDGDARTGGDRLTEVFEELHNLRLELGVTRTVIQQLEKAVRELVAMVSDEEIHEDEPEPVPEPPKRRSRRAS